MSISKGFGQIIQGVASQESGKYTRSVMYANAKNEEADTQMEVERLRDTARLAMGRQVAGLSGGGLQFDGSALDAVRESGIESQLEILQTRRKGSLAATGLRSQGKVAYAQGYNGMIQGFAGAASEFAKSAGSGGADYAAAGGAT